ncbi:MAG: hypothetical protein JNJ90_02620 [Saprospiraceae bacterium]|jgi:hypothetical protein|nr:hypothetical protein [Saprospiraceae bacterium]
MTQFKKGNRVGNRFLPGQSGNPAGRPVSIVTYLSEYYPEMQGTTLTKGEAAKLLVCLSSLPMPDVRRLASSEDVPAFLALAAKAIETSHRNGDLAALNSILDRLFGRPSQPLGNDEENPLTHTGGFTLVFNSQNIEPITSEAAMQAIFDKFEERE